jgi:hypothetical protein
MAEIRKRNFSDGGRFTKMKNVSLVAVLALLVLASFASARAETTEPLPAVALPVLHAHFELRDRLPDLPKRPAGPRPMDAISNCNCIYGPPGSGIQVCGCECNYGISCTPGSNTCANNCNPNHR